MKMTVGKLISAQFTESFKKLMSYPGMPIKASFKLRSINKVIQDEIAKYNEVKDGLLMEVALRNDEGAVDTEFVDGNQNIKLDPAKLPTFLSKIKELDSLEVDIPEFSLEAHGCGSLDLTPSDIYNLEFINE